MHNKRRFYDVAKSIKTKGLAHKAVKKIAKLYSIEDEIKHKCSSPQSVYEYRQQHAKPLLKEFKQWLDDNLHELPSSLPAPTMLSSLVPNDNKVEQLP